MFKKNMTPLTKGGKLDNTPNKGSSQRILPSAATGGGPASTQSYGKATPMAQPAPPTDGLGSGSWPGNGIA